MDEVRIVQTPDTLVRKPRVAGTRLAVDLVLRRLGLGPPAERLLQDYPTLTREDVKACLMYAAELARRVPRTPGSPDVADIDAMLAADEVWP